MKSRTSGITLRSMLGHSVVGTCWHICVAWPTGLVGDPTAASSSLQGKATGLSLRERETSAAQERGKLKKRGGDDAAGVARRWRWEGGFFYISKRGLPYVTPPFLSNPPLPPPPTRFILFSFLPFSFVCERRPLLLRLYASNQSHTKLKSMSAKFLIPLGSLSEPFSSIVRTGKKKKTLSPTTYHILLDELGASQCHMYSFLIPPLVIYNVASL